MIDLKTTLFIKLYLITLPIFLLLDVVWVGVIAKKFYAHQIGFLMAKQVNWYAAVIFYLLFVAGLVLFVIYPAVVNQSLNQAVLFGAFFGLVTYGTYDLTSLALIKEWPIVVTIVDLAWGACLSGIVSAAVYLISKL